MKAARGRVLVRKVETHDTFGGGVIVLPLSARDAMAQYQVEILDVGPPEICEDDECERPHDTQQSLSPDESKPPMGWDETRFHAVPASLVVGAWCLVRPRSFIPISETDPRYFVKQSDIEAIFHVAND